MIPDWMGKRVWNAVAEQKVVRVGQSLKSSERMVRNCCPVSVVGVIERRGEGGRTEALKGAGYGRYLNLELCRRVVGALGRVRRDRSTLEPVKTRHAENFDL